MLQTLANKTMPYNKVAKHPEAIAPQEFWARLTCYIRCYKSNHMLLNRAFTSTAWLWGMGRIWEAFDAFVVWCCSNWSVTPSTLCSSQYAKHKVRAWIICIPPASTCSIVLRTYYFFMTGRLWVWQVCCRNLLLNSERNKSSNHQILQVRTYCVACVVIDAIALQAWMSV